MDPRFHACGATAVLMDVSEGAFDLELQRRLWSLSREGGALRRLPLVKGIVLGVNNVMLTFDPFEVSPEDLRLKMTEAWELSTSDAVAGRLVEVPVLYDRAAGSELHAIAGHVGLDIDEVVQMHTGVEYHVACVGSVPGFAYLVGLPPKLSMPRLPTPRPKITKGSVAIGGAQTGIIPIDMPSGWHVLGSTELELFDPARSEPCLLAAGDRVHFRDAGARS